MEKLLIDITVQEFYAVLIWAVVISAILFVVFRNLMLLAWDIGSSFGERIEKIFTKKSKPLKYKLVKK